MTLVQQNDYCVISPGSCPSLPSTFKNLNSGEHNLNSNNFTIERKKL